jgi:hypothetical protein
MDEEAELGDKGFVRLWEETQLFGSLSSLLEGTLPIIKKDYESES